MNSAATATAGATASAAPTGAKAAERVFRVVVLPGDGIGPEVVGCALEVLRKVAHLYDLTYETAEMPFGGQAVDRWGVCLPDETLEACRRADAVLLGAVGGPKWNSLPAGRRPEAGLLVLRKELGCFANLRPARLPPALTRLSPLKPSVIAQGIDLLLVRELVGGLYFGPKRFHEPGSTADPDDTVAEDVMRYTKGEVRRVAEVAFRLAASRRGDLVSVDKENVLACSRLWRETVTEMAQDWPGVTLSHAYVDNFALQLVRDPGRYDVVLTENTFGDILSDLAGGVTGSLGLLPSASLGGTVALYEPIHGSAPDIAGRGVANPTGAILSVAMLLRHTFECEGAARAVEEAVDRALAGRRLPPDLKRPVERTEETGAGGAGTGDTGEVATGGVVTGEVGTEEFGDIVLGNLRGRSQETPPAEPG